MLDFIKKLFGAAESGSQEDSGSAAGARKPHKAEGGEADYEGFVSYVVQRLVNNPEAVRLEVVEGNGESSILIHCEKSDIAKVIGKRGRTISAIRLLVGGAASRDGKHIKVDVVD